MIKNNFKGATLVELMISMVLGIMIIGSCLHIFVMIKYVFLLQSGVARIQENGRIVNTLLGLPIQQAGNIGCNSFHENMGFELYDGIDKINYGLLPGERLVGLNKAALARNNLVPSTVIDRAIFDSDIVWIKSAFESYKISKKKRDPDSLYVKGNVSLRKNQIVFVSTCSKIKALKVRDSVKIKEQGALTKISFFNNMKALNIKRHYDTYLELNVLSSKIFYVGKTLRLNANGNPVYALYSTDLNGRTLELVEGVEAMKILYGIKGAGKISYLSFDKIDNWSKVVTVRVNLLLNSVEEVNILPEKYQNNHIEITPDDKLMRKWWIYEWAIKSVV